MLLRKSLFGAVRRRTLICWRSTRFSASSFALGRNRSTTIHQISLQRSHIRRQHRPIRDHLTSRTRFPIGTPPDLAILDIKMPRMDGMELLRRLRQKSDIPVIFLTSKRDEIDELFGLKMGADDFIKKPFSRRLLVERSKAVLRRSSGR